MEWIVSLTPEVAADPLDALAAPPGGASIVELRADLFKGLDLRAAIQSCPVPVMVTLRSTAEGGQGPEDSDTRRRVLAEARDAGAALIDLECARDSRLIHELGLVPEQYVLSWHDHAGTPKDLDVVARSMLATNARWVKIVPTTHSIADLAAVLDLHRKHNTQPRNRRRLLTFAMGSSGLASRYLAPLLGPPLSYAAWAEDAAAAPGQLTIEKTEAVISHLDGRPQRVFGTVGAEVSSSLSPVLHAAAYRELGLPYLMLPFSVTVSDELAELFAPRGATILDRVGLEARGWAVTTPYKRLAAASAERHAPRVLRAGAANTLILGDIVTAENTDADGVVGSLMSLGIDPQGRTAIVQGTGGAARGAAVGLDLAGADVFLRGRSLATTERIAEEIGVVACDVGGGPADASILVNATPLGLDPEQPRPFSDDETVTADAVVDMVYGDHETALAALARENGIAVADGREVLLHQGYAQFAAFTQTIPPKEAMRKALQAKNSG